MSAGAPYPLGESATFPDPELADPTGLLAFGGDLAPERLLAAYRSGIFPWPLEDDLPLLWWSPDPRFVLYPGELRVTRSLETRLRTAGFEVTMDTAFEEVIGACATVARPEQEGTWLTPEMIEAYVRLHELGWAHSVESRRDGELVGGLYGVAVGRAFCGESMFAFEADASKVAFVRVVRQLAAWGFELVDCQVETEHLARFGARSVPRARFLKELAHAQRPPAVAPPWTFERES